MPIPKFLRVQQRRTLVGAAQSTTVPRSEDTTHILPLPSTRTLRCLVLAALVAPIGGLAQTSAPPATFLPGKSVQTLAPASLLLPRTAPSRMIVLPDPTPSERAVLNAKSLSASTQGKPPNKRLAIGFARTVPAEQGSLHLSDLPWTSLGDGVRATQIRITSPGAAALRVQLALVDTPPGVTVRFASSASGRVFGPYPAAVAQRPTYWSPVLEGDTATIEITLPADTRTGDATASVPMISHLVTAGVSLKQADPFNRIGTAGSCEVDVACVSSTLQQQAATAIGAVARVVLTDLGQTYLCSGTLLNDSIGSGMPYFFFANHCIDDGDNDPAAAKGDPAAAAASINTYWFFQANECGGDTSSDVDFVMLTGGAKLLGRSVDYDWNLLLLNDPPPPGTTFAAWNASAPIVTGIAADGIHHPEGDLKKFSEGGVSGYNSYPDGSSFVAVQWTQGVTEPGSSGSGLFTYNASGGYYEMRGALYGGASDCSVPDRSGIDEYSRLDVALPLIAQYLTPTATDSAKKVVVVEYYNATLDDYFITPNQGEIQDLDNGVHPGWVRTGLTFLAYSDPVVAPADAQPVCRFYVLPQVGDSHFYSADPVECGATAAEFAGTWVEESPSLFYIEVPNQSTGACPAGTRPVFRFLNDANGLHHRYTAEVDVRDSIISDGGWTQEGYGTAPAASVMCSPTT
jgi:lysyl endopeptidase